MTMYIIRVELHGANAQQYHSLASKLAASGVRDVIIANDGSRYKLPPAEYVYSGSETLEQVVASVKRIANAVHAANAVLVSQAENVRWDGLAVAQYA